MALKARGPLIMEHRVLRKLYHFHNARNSLLVPFRCSVNYTDPFSYGLMRVPLRSFAVFSSTAMQCIINGVHVQLFDTDEISVVHDRRKVHDIS